MYRMGRCLLRARLQESRMTQQELADTLGMKKQQISDYIHNRGRMSFTTAVNIARIIGCSPVDLYQWTEE